MTRRYTVAALALALSLPGSVAAVPERWQLIIESDSGDSDVQDYGLTLDDCASAAVQWRSEHKAYHDIICEKER